MDATDLLLDLYGRIPPLAKLAVDGLDAAELRRIPSPGTNSIGWLIWHVGRVQDHQISEQMDVPQLWVAYGWANRFGMEPEPLDIGFGHTAEQVAAVQPTGPDILLSYLGATQSRAEAMIADLRSEDLDRIVDESWEPPVTLGARLISIADDCLQHVGQACYLRGFFND